VRLLEKGYTGIKGRTDPYKKPEPSWLEQVSQGLPAWIKQPPSLTAQILGPAGYVLPWAMEQAEKASTMAGAIGTAPFRPLPEGYEAFEKPKDWRSPMLPTSFLPGGAQYGAYEQWKGGPKEPYLPLGVPSWEQWGGWLGEGKKPETYQPARMGMGDIAEFAPWMAMGGGPGGRGIIRAGQMLESRTPQIVKTALKEEAGMARLPRKPITPKPDVKPPAQPVAAVDKMLSLLKAEKPVLRETKQLRHVELQKRAAMIGKALEVGEPEAAMARAGKLRAGKLPTAEGTLREQFSPDEASQLFGAIRDSSLRSFEKLNANEAFIKLIQTNDPLTKSEIRLLGEVFGPEFTGMFDTLGQKVVKTLLDIANLPRALLASGEISATLRQGGLLLARRPYLAPKMVKEQVKYFVSDTHLKESDALIRSHPWFKEFNELGGYMAPLPGRITQLWKAEETFMSRFSQHIPVVKQSERAYVGGLNWLRFNSYVHGKQLYEKMGVATEKNLDDLIKLITRASGRGDWKLLKGDIGPIANTLLFSPRLILSRIQFATMLASRNPVTRKEAWKTMASLLAFGTGILSMLKLAGATVELDPRSSDFGKAKIGKTRLDVWTGYAQYARFLAQLATAQRKTTTGRIQELNRLDVIKRFIQSKLSPAAGLLNDILQGTTYMGEEMSFETENLRKQAYNRLTPLFFQDMIDAISEEGLMGGITASPGFLGVGIVTHRPKDAPIIGESPAQQLEDRVWAQYPPQLRQIADQIRELERTDPIAAKKLQRQYPQILNIRRQIALAQVQSQQAGTDRQKAIEQAMKQREAALAGIG